MIRRNGVTKDELLQMEMQADQLLRSSGAMPAQRSLYTDVQLNRKIRLQERCTVDLSGYYNYLDDEDQLLRMYARLAKRARLNPLQEVVFLLYLSGYRQSEISMMLQISKLRAIRTLRIARKKLALAFWRDPYSGWHEVYLSQVNRR